MKIVEIKKEEQIEVGLTYLEILQNSAPDSDTVEKCSRRFLMKGYPVAYEDVHHHPDKVLHGSRWIKSCYIWDDGGRSTTNYHSLSDMGVTNIPYNNHKLYYVAPEDMDAVRKLTIAEFKKLISKE